MCDHPDLLGDLLEAGYLLETGVEGLYGRSGLFEQIVSGIEAIAGDMAAHDGAEVVRFPPAMNRTHFARSGYMKNFPQLAGTVHCFNGGEQDHADVIARLDQDEDWTVHQKPSDVVMTPAACYPLYPVVAKRGPLKADGAVFELSSYCFRHEPSKDPARMQLFRMLEYVRVGSPEQVMDFRETWMERGKAFTEDLRLPYTVDVANDPFFGRAGRLMKGGQRDQGLKFELLIPVTSQEKPTACLSFNYHQDHFGKTCGIQTSDGETAHTACVGFGLERLTIALLRHHGFDVGRWPQAVADKLRLS